jgi:hypothetical protein
MGRHDECANCERCTWNPGPDCGRREHPHCERCGHCIGRHEGLPADAPGMQPWDWPTSDEVES